MITKVQSMNPKRLDIEEMTKGGTSNKTCKYLIACSTSFLQWETFDTAREIRGTFLFSSP